MKRWFETSQNRKHSIVLKMSSQQISFFQIWWECVLQLLSGKIMTNIRKLLMRCVLLEKGWKIICQTSKQTFENMILSMLNFKLASAYTSCTSLKYLPLKNHVYYPTLPLNQYRRVKLGSQVFSNDRLWVVVPFTHVYWVRLGCNS